MLKSKKIFFTFDKKLSIIIFFIILTSIFLFGRKIKLDFVKAQTNPPPPTNFQAKCEVNPNYGYIQIRLTWQGSTGVGGYQVSKARESRSTWNYTYSQIAPNSSNNYVFVDRFDSINPGANTSYGLQAGVMYFYNVRSCLPDQNNCQSFSYASPEIQIKCPAPPRSLSLSCNQNRLRLTWSVATAAEIDQINDFFVSKGVVDQNNNVTWDYHYARISPVAGRLDYNFEDSNVIEGRRYIYNVKSCLHSGSNICFYQIYATPQVEGCCGQGCPPASTSPTITQNPVQSPAPSPSDTPAPPPQQPPNSCSQKRRGDANCDNFIDSADYILWRNQYLQVVDGNLVCHDLNLCSADFNEDRTVDLIDYDIWYDNSTVTN